MPGRFSGPWDTFEYAQAAVTLTPFGRFKPAREEHGGWR
ncbi:Uncharacterised protein [Mycobacterium tuberculosis]|nr:Uncharacterised protein [Mycobacterium tuberculosis]